MSQKLSVGGVKWVENTSQFSKDFIENYNEDSEEEYFLEVDGQYPENYMIFAITYILLRKSMLYTQEI